MNTATTPSVQYGYDSLGRLHSVTYPDGRVVYYNYSATDTDGTLGRLANISTTENAIGVLAAYTYLGDDTISRVDHPQVSGRDDHWSFCVGPGGVGQTLSVCQTTAEG